MNKNKMRKRRSEVVTNKQNRTKVVKNEREQNERSKVLPKTKSASNSLYYSFLTVILVLCLIQITVSAVLNISKIVLYKAKIVQIKNTRDAALATNEQLKDSIKNFSNVAGLEAIARNNLKMSSEDEVLIIINAPKQEEKEEKKHIFNLNFKKDKPEQE